MIDTVPALLSRDQLIAAVSSILPKSRGSARPRAPRRSVEQRMALKPSR